MPKYLNIIKINRVICLGKPNFLENLKLKIFFLAIDDILQNKIASIEFN